MRFCGSLLVVHVAFFCMCMLSSSRRSMYHGTSCNQHCQEQQQMQYRCCSISLGSSCVVAAAAAEDQQQQQKIVSSSRRSSSGCTSSSRRRSAVVEAAARPAAAAAVTVLVVVAAAAAAAESRDSYDSSASNCLQHVPVHTNNMLEGLLAPRRQRGTHTINTSMSAPI